MNLFFRSLAFFAIVQCWLPCAYATSIVVLPEGEKKEVTVQFVWGDPVAITLTGGRIPDSYRITVGAGGIHIGDHLVLNAKSSQDTFKHVALEFYEMAINSVNEMRIFKYIVDHNIFPQYVRLLPDGVTYSCDKYEKWTDRHTIAVKIFRPKTKDLLGTVTIDKDSHEITCELNNNGS